MVTPRPFTIGYQDVPASVVPHTPERPATRIRLGFERSMAIWAATYWPPLPSIIDGWLAANHHDSPVGPPSVKWMPLRSRVTGLPVAPPTLDRKIESNPAVVVVRAGALLPT